MWPSKCCQQWWSPKCSSPYSRWYKYTYCLSGTAECFYAVTVLYVHVPLIAGLMCQTTLELLYNLHFNWICIRQMRACTVRMQHLCLLCFQWVDHSLMPSDKQHGSQHRQVSSRVAYNRKHSRYAVQEHKAYHNMNPEQRGNVSHLTSELDIVGIWPAFHCGFSHTLTPVQE